MGASQPNYKNGLARALPEVIDFVDTRFASNMAAGQKRDLVAFLRSL